MAHVIGYVLTNDIDFDYDGDLTEKMAEENDLTIFDDLEELYDDTLSEVYGEIEICGYMYDAAHAFKEIDPVAYRCELSNFECDYTEVFSD